MGKIIAALSLFSMAAFAQELGKSGETKIIANEAGFVICTGSTSQPLFSKTCETLTMYRVGSASPRYEGLCTDSNKTIFYLACEAFNFEYASKQPFLVPNKR